MYKLNQIKLNINHSDSDFKSKIAKTLKVGVDDINWETFIILHKSIDARDKNNILFVYNVAFDFVGANFRSPHVEQAKKKLEKYEPNKFNPIIAQKVCDDGRLISASMKVGEDGKGAKHCDSAVRPVVVGFGPAGIFASYVLALNGLKPIIVERGKKLEDRTKDVDKFFNTMELDEESNVCFGEGGAGAFSDGKLNTNNKDKTGIYHFILDTFVKFGADEKVLYENMPHIGTDKLVDVIKNIRNEIIRLGGEIHYNTKLTFENGLAKFAPTNGGYLQALGTTNSDLNPQCTCELHERESTLKNAPVILAIGNSSRDTFRELIENGFDLKAKPMAIGYRIAHRQSMIDELQYGGSQSSPEREGSQSSPVRMCNELGPATYKLTYDVGNGHSVYSFCMCPGGYVINSSNYKGMLSINGMSYNDRSGKYANSAIVETISPEDILGSLNSPVQALKMIEFQEMIEKRAFELEKGFIPYVTSEGSDICPNEIFKGQAKYSEKLKTVFNDLGLKFNINEDIEEALRHFNKIMPGFFGGSLNSPVREGSSNSPVQKNLPKQCTHELHEHRSNPEFILAGVETRTSSPVKLDRDENYMCNVKGFYPCGEGLGHGGGIISCAADGVKVALKIAENAANFEK